MDRLRATYTNDYFEFQEREAEIERMNEKIERRRGVLEMEATIEDAAVQACRAHGIGIKPNTLRSIERIERDDDYREGGWWVPCFVFVPGGKDAGKQTE